MRNQPGFIPAAQAAIGGVFLLLLGGGLVGTGLWLLLLFLVVVLLGIALLEVTR